MEESQSKVIPVRVALRVRPLVPREIKEGCQENLDTFADNPQVVLRGSDKAFTFDYVFPSTTSQEHVYESSVSKVVKHLFKGYNVTILAYGQTGSGKTYSMGTAYTSSENEAITGVIPRAVGDIFKYIKESTEHEVIVKVSFMELYKEVLYDLLNQAPRKDTIVDIREDPKGGIKIFGLTEVPVISLDETMKCLEYGATNRATGATAMNSRSSRSHAIFSLHLEIKNLIENNVISAKFHLVDLAGSERAKKTRATGERFKEGVNINMGLLSLGNVISALCEEGHRGHIPYRDSKLTRLLQDSLGGNSHTVMIACVSPADSNHEETLNTLRYADRARKIKNKPIINRDPQTAELSRLRSQIQQLHLQLLASQAGPGRSSVVASNNEFNDLLSLNSALKDENTKLTRALQFALEESTNMAEKALMSEMARDRMKIKLEELRSQTGDAYETLNKTLNVSSNPHFEEQVNLVKGLQQKIMDLQTEQKKHENSIVENELSQHQTQNTSTSESTNTCETTSDTLMSSPIKGDFGAAYTLQQAKLNEELQGLNRALAMKEELMSKMSVNGDQIQAMKSQYEKGLKEHEDQVNALLKERDELNQLLRNSNAKSNSNKISEQRRKRLQELEALIEGLKKKIQEQNRLLKMREQSEKKVSKLSNEIHAMKTTRVKLIRQMKEDGEKFRKWKAQKDREVAKLKEADRQKEFKMVKMERLHSKQQNVLRRKMEEAVAINKRLKDAMALQKACQEKRAASKDICSVQSKMKSWLQGELEVLTVKKQAKHSLQTLIEDRKTLSEKLEQVKSKIDENLSRDLKEEYSARKDSLEKDLQLRNAQISDIQAKVADEDIESGNKRRFDSVQSMVEAKCAMSFLFEVAGEAKTSTAIQKSDLEDLNCQYDELTQHLEETEAELRSLKDQHQAEIDALSREHEDKILFLLRQMPSAVETNSSSCHDGSNSTTNGGALQERLRFQEAELSRLSNLHELLQERTKECEELREKLKERPLNIPVKSEKEENPVPILKKSLEVKHERKSSFPTPVLRFTSDEESSDEDGQDVISEEEDSERIVDPDWKKTPLFRRIRQLTKPRGRESRMPTNDSFEEDLNDLLAGTKRSSSGEIKCGCSRDCSSKLCKCRKNDSTCCVSCKCNALKCINRTPLPSSADNSSSSHGETLLNSTFEVSAKPLLEVSQSKRMRLSEHPLQMSKGEENIRPSLKRAISASKKGKFTDN